MDENGRDRLSLKVEPNKAAEIRATLSGNWRQEPHWAGSCKDTFDTCKGSSQAVIVVDNDNLDTLVLQACAFESLRMMLTNLCSMLEESVCQCSAHILVVPISANICVVLLTWLHVSGG